VIQAGGARPVVARPLVVDLTALWAGPLCAHVLGRAGARVVKVESATRPDAARNGSPGFFDLLHGGHESVELDFEADRRLLHDLVARADVVLEASRPRALRQLGIDAHAHVARGAIWVSITAYGRADELRVGFGDDVAASAGLVAWEDGRPVPAGDALADPLTGITAAAAVVQALGQPRGALLDVSMYDVAVAAGPADPSGGSAPTVVRSVDIRHPRRRIPAMPAAPLGAHTEAVRREFG
jgi:crotonobetainyl-CoA:carnitine CoA-transferase CaiB-like acyl-CoA transferase